MKLDPFKIITANLSKWQFKSISLIVFLAWQINGTPATAQSFEARPTVSRPSDIFAVVVNRVTVGERATFKIKNHAKKVVSEGLQARIFTLQGHQTRPEKAATIDGCNVYISVVLNLRMIDEEHAALPALPYQWLGITDSLENIEPGKYFMVFEKSGPSINEFRLKEGDDNSYFSNGFIFTVSGSKGVTLDMVKEAYFERRDQIGTLLAQISDKNRKVQCYSYRKLAQRVDLDYELIQAALNPCELENQEKLAALIEPDALTLFLAEKTLVEQGSP